MTTNNATYDLLLTGGTLLDPAQNIHDRRDIAFKDGLVAAVAPRIDPAHAAATLDIPGKLVTPGLIDLHGHFYHGGNPTSVNPDQICLASGTTTAVDAGSAGFLNYQAMRDYVFPAHRTRLLAFLHIGAIGLAANRVLGGGLQDMRIIDIDQTAHHIRQNPGFCLGVKVRMHLNAVAHWNAHQAMRAARAAADQAQTRLMVHISGTPIPLPDILEFLGPGDIATHAFNGHPEHILDTNGKIRPQVQAAADRGVIMDLAHAGVHCDITISRAALRQGLAPHTISTDIHTPPPDRTVYLMNDLISKFHAMGMPLPDAIAAATSTPAKTLGLQDQIGSLSPGMAADAAIFDQREGAYVWLDSAGNTQRGQIRLDPHTTIKAGQPAWREGRLLPPPNC